MGVFVSDEQDVEVDTDDLLALVRHVLAERRVPDDMDVALLLVDADTIATMNQEHLGKPGPTDVLAFPIDEPGESPPGGPAVLGDVVLCPSVAAEQATARGQAVEQELRMLVVHGLLHLLGMDHDEPDAQREMFGLTERLLASYVAEDGGEGRS